MAKKKAAEQQFGTHVGSADLEIQAKQKLERDILKRIAALQFSSGVQELERQLAEKNFPLTLDAFLTVYQGFPFLLSVERPGPGKTAVAFWRNLVLAPDKSGLREMWTKAAERLGATDRTRPLAIVPMGTGLSQGSVDSAVVLHTGNPLSKKAVHGIGFFPGNVALEPGAQGYSLWFTVEPLVAFLEGLPAGVVH